ncbi:hypothetical protein IV102_03170 [bacterium]|nr:hypothetical protein [bacterium]
MLLLTTGLAAEPAAEARKAIEALYARADRACEKWDVDGVYRDCRGDYIFTSTSGDRRNLEALRKRRREAAGKLDKVRASSRIVGFQMSGSRATVQVRSHFEAEYKDWMPGRPSKFRSEELDQDLWVRGPKGWQSVTSDGLWVSHQAGAKTTERRAGYVRLVREDGHPTAMEVAIATFVAPGGLTVDLVGAVHMAEKDYYKQLNREFTGYQAVLYELIAPHEGERLIPQAGDETDNPLSATQVYLTNLLGFTFQLSEVDYRPSNFVHADLSPEELLNSMTKRGESAKTMVAQLLHESLKNSTDVDPADAMALNYSMASIMVRGATPRDRLILRRVLASSFKQVEKMTAALSGPHGSTLIQVRNQAALAVMKREVKRGRKRLAIFYGAAHLPDLETRLLKQGFTKQGMRYLKAWDLRKP